ncbi:MAG: PLP-dependent aspartate aminotransferase family protein [Anaerolineae bacterium]|nr:PLP-dependent aspartate aminotransferase family protein [Anaerolineae bacterium]
MSQNNKLTTRLVHEGEHPERNRVGAPTVMPIVSSATYVQTNAEGIDWGFANVNESFTYIRRGNPTVQALETAVASAEETTGAIATATGMAAMFLAIQTALYTPSTKKLSKRILCSRDVFGSTFVMLKDVFALQGYETILCDITDLDEVKRVMHEQQPDVLIVEAISNPMLKVSDIPTLTAMTHEIGGRMIVDATITTPVLRRMVYDGVDFIMHSATKYLNGHGDIAAGVVAVNDPELLKSAQKFSRLIGLNLAPYEARMVSRGMKTLTLRMRQQCENANAVAAWLAQQPAIKSVFHPSLPNHPQHELCKRLFDGKFGAVVSFELADVSRAAVFGLMDRCKIITPTTSIGDIYTLMTYPAISSHRDIAPDERARQGITDGLVRLSVGIEDAEDIIADLAQALA